MPCSSRTASPKYTPWSPPKGVEIMRFRPSPTWLSEMGYIKLLHLGILPAPKRSLEMQVLTP